MPPPVIARGLEGVIVNESSICKIDGELGELSYRGYSIADLAEVASFEEVAHLLWCGDLPNRRELSALQATLERGRALPPGVVDQLRALPRRARPMDVLRTVVSLLGAFESPLPGGASPTDVAAERLRRAVGLTGAMATAIAAFHRIREQMPIVEPRSDLGHGANFLWMLLGEPPDRDVARSFDTALVLHMEHGLNASTFAGRVAASTQADLHGAVTAAVATLEGPLHGGANERVMEMLAAIGRVDRAAAWVRERLARRDKIMGFGHRVYRTEDPRARVLRRMSEQLTRERGMSDVFEISRVVEDVVVSTLGDKGIAANVDFYSASLYHAIGIPRDIFTPVFALARVVGWTAHILEQYAENRLIRPKSSYVGAARRDVVPLVDR